MALHLAGLAPIWDAASERVTGFEVTPLALMDRPRIEVTLRVSGLFRDTFPELVTLFQQGCAALAARDEAADMNPYVAAAPGAHVFAPAPGRFGTGITDDMSAEAAGRAWLRNSAFGPDGTSDRAGFEARLRAADGFVLTQDLPETDLLLAMDYASHEAGFAAARTALGLEPTALYHLDATRPDTPRARLLPEEIARVVRARATWQPLPGWRMPFPSISSRSTMKRPSVQSRCGISLQRKIRVRWPRCRPFLPSSGSGANCAATLSGGFPHDPQRLVPRRAPPDAGGRWPAAADPSTLFAS